MEFKIKDKKQAEKVVLKCMLEMLEVLDKEDTKRFIQEVQIMNEVKHPNTVEYKRVCFEPCAFMMEYLCFSSLKVISITRCKRKNEKRHSQSAKNSLRLFLTGL